MSAVFEETTWPIPFLPEMTIKSSWGTLDDTTDGPREELNKK